jgi:hypothetical protein
MKIEKEIKTGLIPSHISGPKLDIKLPHAGLSPNLVSLM